MSKVAEVLTSAEIPTLQLRGGCRQMTQVMAQFQEEKLVKGGIRVFLLVASQY